MTARRAFVLLALAVSAACSQAPAGPAKPASGAPAASSAPAQAPAAQVAATQPAPPRVLKVGIPTIDVNYLLPISVAEYLLNKSG